MSLRPPRRLLGAVVVLAASAGLAAEPPRPRGATHRPAAAVRLPLYFVENQGQFGPGPAFVVDGGRHALAFGRGGVHVTVSGAGSRHVVRQELLGARPVDPVGLDPAEARFSYFRGARPEWRSAVPSFTGVVYREAWPGIDVAYAGDTTRLKTTFLVAPGADPSAIRLAWRGASTRLRGDGAIDVETPSGSFVDGAPVAYQDGPEGRRPVAVAHRLHGGTVSFAVGPYDTTRPLVIDPEVVVSAGFLGSTGTDGARAVAVDGKGSTYVAGYTTSTGFPVLVGPDTSHNGGTDAFVAKVNAAGTGLEWAGFLGGSASDIAHGVDVDPRGNVYVVGDTSSTDDFPATTGPFLAAGGGGDAFVAKVDASGSLLLYAGFLGGSAGDGARAVRVDGSGAAYVGGYTLSDATTFPETVGPDLTAGGSTDGFVAKVVPSGGSLAFCTFVGGSGLDEVRGLDLGSGGTMYAVGHTSSTQASFPALGTGYDGTYNGGGDAFLLRIAADGSAFTYGSFLGGTGDDSAHAVDVDATGAAYVAGEAGSTDFPTAGVASAFGGGSYDAFATRFNADGSALTFSRFLGGTGNEFAYGISEDGHGNAYVVGSTGSGDFPVNLAPGYGGGTDDGFVVRLTSGAIDYARYLGGSAADYAYGVAVDRKGYAHVVGATSSTESTFPVVVGPSLVQGGDSDAFVARLSPSRVFAVTTTADTVDVVPGDGTCADAGAACSLRAAVMEANAIAGQDTITVPAGTYVLTRSGSGEDLASTGDLDVLGPVIVLGNSSGSTFVDGNAADRVFHFMTNDVSYVSNVTLRNGTVSGAGGGVLKQDAAGGHVVLDSVMVTGGLASGGFGGGLYSAGGLVLHDSSVLLNSTVGGGGGGIFNDSSGTLTLVRTLVAWNSDGADGGGLHNNGTATLTNTTVSGNSANNGGGVYIAGGSGSVTLSASTVTKNTAATDGGGVYYAGPATVVGFDNTILAANSDGGADSPDCRTAAGSLVSNGNNVIGIDAGCTFGATGGDQVGTTLTPVSPKLGPLVSNGGPTRTHAVLTGSPAFDAGNPGTPGDPTVSGACPALDQRGQGRPSGTKCDVGAFEGSVPTSADFGITSHTDSADPVAVGASVTYTIVVANNGPSTAGGLLTIKHSGVAFTFVSAVPSQGSCTGLNPVYCDVGSLSPGTLSVAVTVTPTDYGTLVSQAQVTANATDTSNTNDTSSQTTSVGNCTKTFDNGGGDLKWGTATNWNPDGVPTGTDRACIGSAYSVVHDTGTNSVSTISANGTLTVSGGTLLVTDLGALGSTFAGALTVSGGTLTFNAAASVAQYSQSGGTLGGLGTVTVSSSFSWSGGTLSAAGQLNLGASVVGTISGATARTLSERTLNNGGTLTWTGSAVLTMSNGAVFNNLAGAIFDAQATATVGTGGGTTPVFNNAGTFKKTTNAGTVTFSGVNFNNNAVNAVVEATVGTLAFSGTTFTQSAGTTTVTSALLGGTLSFAGGTLQGAGTITGAVSHTGGALRPGTSAGQLTISGSYSQGAGAILYLEIGGVVAGTQYDRLVVTGAATLNGALDVTRSYVPAVGESYTVMTYASQAGGFAAGTTGLDPMNPSLANRKFVASFGGTALTLTTTSTLSANLGVSMSDAPDPSSVGSVFAYTISVLNSGPDATSGVRLVDRLPHGVSFVSVTPSQGVCAEIANVVRCALGTLNAGQSASLTLSVVPRLYGLRKNVVRVSGTEPDPDPSNNVITRTTTVNATAAACASPTFTASGPFATGASPQGIALARLDGGTLPDLVTTSGSSSAVSVLLGTGSGTTFAAPATYPAPASAVRGVAVADFNDDGLADVATAQGTGVASSLSVFPGTGTGTLGAASNLAAGGQPSAVAAADLNHDLRPDLVSANASSNDLSVLLGKGDGTFQAATAHAVGGTARAVEIADVDDDGNPDLVVASDTASQVYVFTGDGTGGFAGPTAVPVGAGPTGLAVGDLNGDGLPDIVTANSLANTVSVVLNTGTFTATRHPFRAARIGPAFGAAVDYGAGSGPSAVAVLDANRDGRPDLAVTLNGSSQVALLTGDGTGSFGVPTTIATGAAPTGLAVGDLDGNGRADLVVANSGDGTVSALLNGCASADVSATLADAPDPVTAGGNLTYTATIANAGPDATSATAATVTLPPSGVTFVSATPSQGSCTGTAPVSCSLGALAAGASATVTVVVTTTTGAVQLSATAGGSSTLTDPNAANNTSPAQVTSVNPAGYSTFFTGPSGGSWTNPAHWSTGVVPGPSDTVFIGAGRTVTLSGASAVNAVNCDGTLEIAAGGSLTVAGPSRALNLTLSGGTKTGAGSFTVDGTFTATGGTVSGFGGLSLLAGSTSTFAMGTATLAVDGTGLGNAGAATWTSGTLDLRNGAVFTNAGGGTFTTSADLSLASTTGNGSFVNQGTFTKSGGTGSTTVGAAFTNGGGTLNVNAGTLAFTGPFTQTAGTTTLGGGSLSTTTTLNLQGGVLRGPGTISGGVSNTGAAVQPGASPGFLTVTGNYSQGPSGALDVEIGGTTPGTQYDRLDVLGTASLAGTLNLVTFGGYVPAAGSTFQVLTAGTRTGTFATVTGSPGTAGRVFATTYGATTVTVAAQDQADLATTIVDSPDPVLVGADLTYTFTAKNLGPMAATNVGAGLTLPPSLTLVSVTPSQGSCSGTGVSCNLGTIAASGQATITVVVKPQPPATGTVTVTGSASPSAELDPNGGNNASSQSTAVNAAVDLSVTMTDNPDPVLAGSVVTYGHRIANAGPSTATNVVFTDTLPAGTTFVSASPASGSCTGTGPVTCTVPSMAPGAFTDIAVRVQTSTPGTITNTASVTATETDTATANNTASASTTVNPSTADLEAGLTDSPDPVPAGSNLTYTLGVKNNGPAPANGVVLYGYLPSAVTLVNASPGCTLSGRVLTCPVGALAPSASTTFTAVARPTQAPATLAASVFVTQTGTDGNAANDSASQSTTVTAVVGLAVTVTDSPDPVVAGTPLTYTMTVGNSGPSSATSVALRNTLPATVAYLSGSPGCVVTSPRVTCSRGVMAVDAPDGPPDPAACAARGETVTCTRDVLAVGESVTFGLVGRPEAAGTLIDTVTASATEPDANTADNSATATTTVLPAADLSLAVTDAPDPVVAGSVLVYTATVSNNGPSPASAVTLTDTLPSGATFVAASPGCTAGTGAAAGTVTCALGPVAAGSTASAMISVRPSSPGFVTNAAAVSAPEADLATANNSVSVVTTVTPATTETVDLQVTVADAPDPVVVGSDVTYTVSLTNAGRLAATSVVLYDYFGSAATFVSASAPCVASVRVVTCPVGTLASGASTTVTVVVRPSVGPSTITNAAYVTVTEPDANPADNTASQATAVQGAAALSLTLDDAPDPVVVGGTLTYTSTVRNAGPSTATTVTLTQTLPVTGATFVSASSGCSAVGSTVTCVAGAVSAGQSAVFTVAVRVTEPGTASSTASVAANETDPNPTDNTGRASTQVAASRAEAAGDETGVPVGRLLLGAAPPPRPARAAVRLTVADVTVAEAGGGPATFALVLSEPLAEALVVRYRTAEASAEAGADFEAGEGTVTIPAGALRVEVVVPIRSDDRAEGDEAFWLRLEPAVLPAGTDVEVPEGAIAVIRDALPER